MSNLNKTFLPNKNYKTRNWFIIDCKEQKLGRLATLVVTILKGKIKPHYYPSIDIGDYVILTNANDIKINSDNKHYLVYKPGRPGHSLKIVDVVNSIPKLTIRQAVKGMLSKTERKQLLTRLNIYSDHNHPHKSQNPIQLDISQYALKALEYEEILGTN